jgi:tripartite-type tricarboxylate transporter receptor subunit TctC
MKNLFRCAEKLLLVCFASCAFNAAVAQEYPNRPIRMILGFPPGGTTDINARILAQKVSEQLGQSVVVDNRAGAGGNIAAAETARAAADGYTIFYNTSSVVIAPAMSSKLSFDPLKSFSPVVLMATVPIVLVASKSAGIETVKDLVTLAKQRPGAVRYASSGIGTVTHLASALLSTKAGISMTHIPYKGAAPALQDLVGGQLEIMSEVVNTVLPYAQQGKIRVLATATPKRLAELPNVPTFDEAFGSKGFEMGAWQGLMVPAGTPPAVIARLNTEFNKALQDPVVRERLQRQGAEPLGGSAEAYATYLRSELARWATVVMDSGAKSE